MKFLFLFLFLAASGSSLSRAQPKQPVPQDGQSGWYKQSSTAIGNSGGIFFLNRDTGWVSFSDGLISTSNGGVTWTMLYPFPAYFPHFVDALNGWAVGDTSLLKTSDGGKNWQAVHAPLLGRLQTFGLDTLRIYNYVYPATASSNDGGKTWIKDDASEAMGHAQQGSMFFVDSKYGFLCGLQVLWFNDPPPPKGTNGAGFVVTTNGGVTWHAKYCPIQEDLSEIYATDIQTIFASTSYGNIVRSSDGGSTWAVVYNGHNIGQIQSFFFVNKRIGYGADGNGEIRFTEDSGKSWITQNSTVSTWLNSIFFVDSLTGWASGEKGVVLHTLNGGRSWVRQYIPTPVKTSVSPEPFAQKTTITYSLPQASKAVIRIFDMTGKQLEVLESRDIQEAGTHTMEFDGSRYPSGAFYYRLEADGIYGTGKMTKIAQ